MQPVLVGVGQETWRERGAAGTPVDALAGVAQRAGADSGSANVLPAIDAIVQIPFIMTQVEGLRDAMPRNAAAALASRLGLRAKTYGADVGGNLPQQLVNEMSARLVRGEHELVLLAGVELLATFLGAVRAGEPFPDWGGAQDPDPEQLVETPAMLAPTEQAHDLFEPKRAYPLFESAICHALGLSPEDHRARLGGLVSRMSQVAAANPYAWDRRALSPDEVVRTEGGNRMICHPYTKVMNSVIAVDQAAAVILTTARKARALGIGEERWVYLRGAASAHDTWYLGERRDLHRSPALELAAPAALAQAGLGLDELDFFDIYSCFPSAVQVACTALGLEIDDPRGLTVTGGMSLFGGPGNNYSLHAIASLVERLRERDDGAGLITANGGYLTKHAVGVYARAPAPGAWTPPQGAELQARVDARGGPALVDRGEGRFVIDAHTVSYSRGAVDRAIVLGRVGGGQRCVAISDREDVIDAFLQRDCIGEAGAVEHREGQNHFRF
jgi:acetyl-CoA C-acetyltransferase